MPRIFSPRTLVLGGLAAAAAAAALKKRTGGRRLLGRGDPGPAPAPSEAPVGTAANVPGPAPAPPVANVDVPGPPANTATPVPAPEPEVHEPTGGIDELAEEQAAAAEAANIGGGPIDYPGTEPGELADEETAPLIEAGEGEAEGQEVTEFELQDYAEPAAGDPIEGGRQIEDVIEQQDDPTAGEAVPADQSTRSEPEPADAAAGAATPADAQLAIPDAPPPAADARIDDDVAPAAPGTPEPAPGDTLAAGTVDDGAPTTGGSLAGTAGTSSAETPASEKSANVWRGDEPREGDAPAPAAEGEAPAPTAEGEGGGSDDDGGEWQTWSGRAVEP
jgi:hypothetical protein